MDDFDLQFFAEGSASEFTHGLKSLDPSDDPSMFGGLCEYGDQRFLEGQKSKQPEQQLDGALNGALILLGIEVVAVLAYKAYQKAKTKLTQNRTQLVPIVETKDREESNEGCTEEKVHETPEE